MFDPKTPLAILGLALSMSGTIAGGYLLAERIFHSTLFSVFLLVTPSFLHSLFPHDPTIIWFRIRSNRNLYQMWDMALIYLLLLPLVFILMVGFWVFLVLRIFGVYNLGTFWLSFWFIVLCFTYMWSAVNQHAVEMKAKHKRANVERIKGYMMQDPIATSRRWLFYFFVNWIKSPFTTLKLLLIVILFVLLHWPAWLLKGAGVLQMNFDDTNTRKYYYIGYMVTHLVAGLVLMFLYH